VRHRQICNPDLTVQKGLTVLLFDVRNLAALLAPEQGRAIFGRLTQSEKKTYDTD
jgi:hypothetical protein